MPADGHGPDLAGTFHPNTHLQRVLALAPLAQLDSAPVYEIGGCRFEFCTGLVG